MTRFVCGDLTRVRTWRRSGSSPAKTRDFAPRLTRLQCEVDRICDFGGQR
jgi:hypothetical protein